MVEMKTKICDICQETVAQYKCILCENDICKHHCYVLQIDVTSGYIPFRLVSTIPDDPSNNCFCKKCERRLSNELAQISREDKKIIFEKYTKFLKEIFILVEI